MRLVHGRRTSDGVAMTTVAKRERACGVCGLGFGPTGEPCSFCGSNIPDIDVDKIPLDLSDDAADQSDSGNAMPSADVHSVPTSQKDD